MQSRAYLATGDLAAADVQIEGRAIKYHPLPNLMDIRWRLKAEVAGEAAAERAKAAGIDPRRYKIRLGVD